MHCTKSQSISACLRRGWFRLWASTNNLVASRIPAYVHSCFCKLCTLHSERKPFGARRADNLEVGCRMPLYCHSKRFTRHSSARPGVKRQLGHSYGFNSLAFHIVSCRSISLGRQFGQFVVPTLRERGTTEGSMWNNTASRS